MDSSFVITYNKNLIKISSTGQEVWKESINERATLLVENADSSFTMVYNNKIFKVSSDGKNELWNKSMAISPNEITVTDEGGYAH